MKRLVALLLFSVIVFRSIWAQQVGLTLSGGGVLGMAHIGVIRALEEAGVPIDYITGTSAGALIGGFYAAGYTAAEMERLALENTRIWLGPGLVFSEEFYFKKHEPDGTFIQLPLSFRGLKRALPENLVSDFEINIGLVQSFSAASAAAGNNFDSLFVPYRAMASDIFLKQAIPLSRGSLAFAVRASIAVPLFFSAASNDEYQNLFDGGVYDNFPVGPMSQIFKPDFIIGVNVNGQPSTQEDVENKGSFVRQLLAQGLIDQKTWEKMPENGLIIEPDLSDVNVSNFSRQNIETAIRRGYDAAKGCMDDILKMISRRVPADSVAKRREAFKKKIPPLVVDQLVVKGAGEWESRYIKNTLRLPQGETTFDEIRKSYLRLKSDGKYAGAFPELRWNPATRKYDMHFFIKQGSRFNVRFGGAFFTPTDHQLQAGFRYQGVGLVGYELDLDLARGSFTNHARLRARLDVPTKIPLLVEGEVSFMQWELQRLRFSLFSNDKTANISFDCFEFKPALSLPITPRSKLTVGYALQDFTDGYYGRPNVALNEAVDQTRFKGGSAFVLFQKNSFNKKMYPTKGSQAFFSARLNEGFETFLPADEQTAGQRNFHRWVQGRASYTAHNMLGRRFGFGWTVEGAFSSLKPYANLISTQLSSPKFTPLQDSPVLFLPQLYSKFYGAAGLKFHYNILPKLAARAEGYYMQSFQKLEQTADGLVKARYDLDIANNAIVAAAGLTFDSPIGPIGGFVNYYNNAGRDDEFRVMIHIGYMIFSRHPWQ